MSKWQAIVVMILFVGGMAGLFLAAAYFSGEGRSRIKPTRLDLLDKPGPGPRVWETEGVHVPGAGESPDSGDAMPGQDSGAADDTNVQSGPPAPEQVRSALAALDPLEGIGKLLDFLSTPEGLAHATEVYSAMGALRLQTDPPELEGAQEAFAEAYIHARSLEELQDTARKAARAYHAAGAAEQAVQAAQRALAASSEVTGANLWLRLSLASSYEELGRDGEAAPVYGEVMDAVETSAATLGRDGEALYREASRKLVRLLRARGQDQAAAEVTKRFKRGIQTFALTPQNR